MTRITRRDFAAFAAAALLARPAFAQTNEASLITRAVPSTGERLPAVGLGTAARVFISDDEPTRRAAAQVVQTLVDGGGQLIDTASSKLEHIAKHHNAARTAQCFFNWH